MATAISVHQPYWKKLAFAAMVFIGLGTFTKEANAQSALGKLAPPKTTLPEKEPGMLMGEVVVIRISPETQALHNYLAKHCSVPDTTNGRVLVSFQLKKDGTVNNIAVSEQLSEPVRMEVLRVLNKALKSKRFNQYPNQDYLNAFSLNFINGKIKPFNIKH